MVDLSIVIKHSAPARQRVPYNDIQKNPRKTRRNFRLHGRATLRSTGLKCAQQILSTTGPLGPWGKLKKYLETWDTTGTFWTLWINWINVYPLVIKHGTGKSAMNGGLNRKITNNWSIFHCHVWLPDGRCCSVVVYLPLWKTWVRHLGSRFIPILNMENETCSKPPSRMHFWDCLTGN